MKKELTVNEYWNGINLEDYALKIKMDQTCSTLENIEKMTISETFKYKELEEKLNNFVNTYDKILLNIPFGDLKRRFKTLTEKLGFKIERTTSLAEVKQSYERVYVVLTK
jgi:hypothetical protein